jgi:hypothetical protein
MRFTSANFSRWARTVLATSLAAWSTACGIDQSAPPAPEDAPKVAARQAAITQLAPVGHCAAFSLTRTQGAPNEQTFSFQSPCASASADQYTLVVDSNATSANVFLNGRQIWGPSSFRGKATHLESPAAIVAGTNTITLRVASAPGDVVTASLRKKGFGITVAAPVPGACFNSFPALSGTTTDSCIAVRSNGAAGTAANGAIAVASVPVVESQEAGVSTIGSDWCNNTSTDERTVIYDVTQPALAVGGFTDGAFVSGAVTPTVSVTDLNLVSQQSELTVTTGDAYAPPGSGDATQTRPFTSGETLSAEGDYTLSIGGQDCATNESALVRRFTIDTTQPRITLGGASEGQIVRDDALAPTFEVADRNLAAVTATLAFVASGSSTETSTPFASGTTVSEAGRYTLTVAATDKAGNESRSSLSFTISICGNAFVEPLEDCESPFDGCCTEGCNFRPSGVLCRAQEIGADGTSCDVAEVCTGASAECPPDLRVAAGTVCRENAGECDVPATCDGASVECAANPFRPSTAVCRPATSQCDVAETCSGSGSACPGDALLANGTSCDDASACTQTDTCQEGVCTGSDPVFCAPTGSCHATGVCDPATGQCSEATPLADGTVCDDGNVCTRTDRCVAGACTGGDPVVCAAPDQCHDAGVCDPVSGCSAPPRADGALCETNVPNVEGVCTAGVCGTPCPATGCTVTGSGALAEVSVVVPAGAVPEGTVFTVAPPAPEAAETLTELVPEGLPLAGPIVTFGPPGTTFDAPVTITIPKTPGTQTALFTFSADNPTWTFVPSVDNGDGTVTAEVWHFSSFTNVDISQAQACDAAALPTRDAFNSVIRVIDDSLVVKETSCLPIYTKINANAVKAAQKVCKPIFDSCDGLCFGNPSCLAACARGRQKCEANDVRDRLKNAALSLVCPHLNCLTVLGALSAAGVQAPKDSCGTFPTPCSQTPVLRCNTCQPQQVCAEVKDYSALTHHLPNEYDWAKNKPIQTGKCAKPVSPPLPPGTNPFRVHADRWQREWSPALQESVWVSTPAEPPVTRYPDHWIPFQRAAQCGVVRPFEGLVRSGLFAFATGGGLTGYAAQTLADEGQMTQHLDTITRSSSNSDAYRQARAQLDGMAPTFGFWNSATQFVGARSCDGGTTLTLDDDGVARLRKDGVVRWASTADPVPAPYQIPNLHLELTSVPPDYLKHDPRVPIKPGWRLVMNPDGNLTVEDYRGATKWESGTSWNHSCGGQPCRAFTRLEIHDGYMAIKADDGAEMWNSCPLLKRSCAPDECGAVSNRCGGTIHCGACAPPPAPAPGGLEKLVFDHTNGMADTRHGDWRVGSFKAECGPTGFAVGISNETNSSRSHALLCVTGAASSYPHNGCNVRVFDNSSNQGTSSSGDWDFGYYKGECAANEYVAGVSQHTDGKIDAILCCPGAVSHNACSVIDAGVTESGGWSGHDWDLGYHKGECGQGRYLAGISRHVSSGEPHALLCCSAVSFAWSSTGPISGMACTQTNEPSDPHTWADNYLCASEDVGLRWSSAGPIPGMTCTAVNEPSEPPEHTWPDNYVCVPAGSPYSFAWSASGPIPGRTCIPWNEAADPHTWGDNYLCW